jgi:hypothetical protein
MVMQATDLRDFPDRTALGRLHHSRIGGIHGQWTMGTPTVIIGKIAHEDAPEVVLMQHDDVVQAFAAQ